MQLHSNMCRFRTFELPLHEVAYVLVRTCAHIFHYRGLSDDTYTKRYRRYQAVNIPQTRLQSDSSTTTGLPLYELVRVVKGIIARI